jgi:hypothetical protein
LLKLNYLKREREILLNINQKDKIYAQSLNELIYLIQFSPDNIPRVIPVIELLIDLYLPTELCEETLYTTNEFLKCNVKNEEIYKYYIHSDFNMFYKLKKIIKLIENNQMVSNNQINHNIQIIK